MNRTKSVIALLGIASLASFASTANAQSVVFTDSFGPATTNWTETLSIPSFDTTLGTLTSVNVGFSGNVFQNYSFESLDAAPATVTASLNDSVTLNMAAGLSGSALSLVDNSSTAFTVSAFDGAIDFGGTSGVTVAPFTLSGTGSNLYTAAGDLAVFTAGGNVLFPAAANGSVVFTGAGNLLTLVNTSADIALTVTYNYRPAQTAVPEPGSVALLIGGALSGAVVLRRRRK